jgi:2-succinyl-5-enolpyruvyl-6-hydroxy-3-cyclohexene-1-carboxylate synthase
MTDTGTLNYRWSQAIIAGFVATGVSRAVISPGSRSTPLALAMLRQSDLVCDVAVDERSAAFFALGIAKANRQPVLLLATSGTAPANWLPAVIEASQSGIPLILISADRPPELQDCGANQTIEQINLFGCHVRASHALGAPDPAFDPAYLHRLAARACEQATWPHPGPVHINQPFREPLLPLVDVPAGSHPTRIRIYPPSQAPAAGAIKELSAAISGRPGLIVCGQLDNNPEFASAVTQLADKLSCPILAEPLSNLRYGKHSQAQICLRYNRWLADPAFIAEHRPAWVFRFGAYPVTRHLQALLAAIDGPHALVDPWPRWSDPAQRLTHLLRADPATVCNALLAQLIQPVAATWSAAFKAIDQQTGEDPASPHIPVLLAELPDNCPLFVGNSLAIRQLDSNSGTGEKRLYFYGNRGASGIDGNISTTAGIAAIHGRAVALLGDLTCQHDLGGLALLAGRNVVIVAVNNAGGGIFDYLPQAALPEFEIGWRTPQQINFKHAAQTFGINHAAADNLETFRSAIRQAIAQGGAHLVELRNSLE